MLPLVYNRRHFGVIFFAVAANHAGQVLDFYHAYGGVSKIESLLTNDVVFTGASAPFQLFGAGALAIFCLMAVTSHDFWQKMLAGRTWKSLHMMVYAGYALVVAHVAFGALQFETSPWLAGTVAASVALVGALHVTAAVGSTRADRARIEPIVELDSARWIPAGPAAALIPGRARRLVLPNGENLALVRDGETIRSISGGLRQHKGHSQTHPPNDTAPTSPRGRSSTHTDNATVADRAQPKSRGVKGHAVSLPRAAG